MLSVALAVKVRLLRLLIRLRSSNEYGSLVSRRTQSLEPAADQTENVNLFH